MKDSISNIFVVHSDASENKSLVESPRCSEAKDQPAADLNCHAARDSQYQSACDLKFQSASEAAYPTPSDNRYPCSSDTKYQSVYVISDQKDECIIATEVRMFSIRLKYHTKSKLPSVIVLQHCFLLSAS